MCIFCHTCLFWELVFFISLNLLWCLRDLNKMGPFCRLSIYIFTTFEIFYIYKTIVIIFPSGYGNIEIGETCYIYDSYLTFTSVYDTSADHLVFYWDSCDIEVCSRSRSAMHNILTPQLLIGCHCDLMQCQQYLLQSIFFEWG